MKILFCIYQLDFADHIAIPYLSAIAKEQGHSTDLCVLQDNSLVDAVKAMKPDVVAYSANTVGFREIIIAHKNAQKVHSYISILGGPQATFSPDTFDEAGVDAYCLGEGELSFREFLERVGKGIPFDDVMNIITKSAKNPVRPLIPDLSKLPLPDRDITMSHSFLKHTAKKTFYTTRGCPFQCNYCANSYYIKLYRGKGPIVRRFPVEHVLAEIDHVKKFYRTEFIKFGDDVFAMKADDWLEEFSDKYAKRIKIPFNCFLRLDTVDEKLLRLLKRSGCHSVHLSVDSSSEHVREKILGRKMRKINIIEKLKLIKSYGINTWVNFMLAAPESTIEDDLKSIELSKKGKVTYTNYSTTVPMKGTVLYSYCVENCLIDLEKHVSDMTGCTQPSTLKCFDQRAREVRYNIFLLGPIVSKLYFPFDWIGKQVIKNVPPNKLFYKIQKKYYEYSIENKIFSLHRKAIK
jgi:anaerobic magnesium-protoporphyrin IX monomethyl ester cyclase